MMCIAEILSSPDVCEVQTQGPSSANHVKHINNSSNHCMEHGCACGAMCIEEFTKFSNACFANLVDIKKERGTNFWGVLDFLPN